MPVSVLVVVVLFFEKGSCCVTLDGLELIVQTRLFLSSQSSICLCLLNAEVKGVEPNVGSPVPFNQEVLEVLNKQMCSQYVCPYNDLVPLAATICLDQTELSYNINRLL